MAKKNKTVKFAGKMKKCYLCTRFASELQIRAERIDDSPQASINN